VIKKTILVSGASGVVGYGILRSLRKSQESYRLIGTTIHDFSIAPAFCDVFEKALPTNHPAYIEWLCSIIGKYSVDMIIPGIEPDMFKWNEERKMLSATGTFPLLNNSELINLCFDKWQFYQQLINTNKEVAIPTVIDGDFSIFPTPFLLKPRRGYGSKGIFKINNEKEFEAHREKLGNGYIMQPIVGNEDEEYTVSAFFDKSSQLIDYFSFRRKLSGDGFTLEAQVVDFDFEDILLSLARTFNPLGPTNFQFRIDGKNVKLLEINPRISSATSLRSGFGYNESVMSVNYFLNHIVPVKLDKKHIINKRAIRYMEDYIFL
jgi:carbamoyl-phosphate synthase large subunit